MQAGTVYEYGGIMSTVSPQPDTRARQSRQSDDSCGADQGASALEFGDIVRQQGALDRAYHRRDFQLYSL